MMTRQLATLLGAGFPLVSALESVITQTDSARLQTVLAQLREKIVEGQSMAEALQAYPHIFSGVYTNMIRAGETSGTLELVMERLADISEKQEAMNRLFRILAHHSAQLVNFSQMGGQVGLDDKTTRRYVLILEKLFLVRRLEPWFRNRLGRDV